MIDFMRFLADVDVLLLLMITPENEQMKQAVDLFNELNPDMKITMKEAEFITSHFYYDSNGFITCDEI